MDSVWLSGARGGVSFRTVLAAAFAPFSAFILFAAARMPMSYDDAFNATLPLNLLRGNGYSSHFDGIEPFDPAISSGAAFLGPAALPMGLFGTGMQWPMLYTGVLCLALYLCLLRRLHRHAPPAALATAILVPLTLWQGKNDRVVTGDILPAPPYGYWYQLLGNLPGLLALALALTLLVKPGPMPARRWIAILALAAFGVNAKLMHVIPLVAMVVAWAVLPSGDGGTASTPTMRRRRRFTVGLSVLAAAWCGFWFNRALAWTFLDRAAFTQFATQETQFLIAHNPAAVLLSVPRSALPGVLTNALLQNAPRAFDLFGGQLQFAVTLAGLVAAGAVALRQGRRHAIARLGLVFTAGAVAHFLWWVCLPDSRSHHLTPVFGLVCFALGCGFGSWHPSGSDGPRWRQVAWGAALALVCAVGAPRVVGALGAWGELRAYRNQQINAAATLRRLAGEYPDATFCAPGWWLPRQLMYLAPEDTRYCNLNRFSRDAPGRRILMLSTNLWPMELDDVRAAAARCTMPLGRDGRFEFRGCDDFVG